MTKAKAKRYAERLTRMVHVRCEWLGNGIRQVTYSPATLRDERDFLLTLAVELRLLSEGKRLPQKRKAVR